jgi:uncharacterized iron-regulated protein
LAGLISEEHFWKSSHGWDDYLTKGRPLFEFSKSQNIKVIAAKALRR